MAMSELNQKLLIYELAKIGFRDAQYYPASDRVQVQPDNDRMPVINDAGEIVYGTEYNILATNTLRPLADSVNEAVAAWDKSHTMPFKDLSQFRVLAEYNNIMLAARDDTVYGRGLHFVTWQYNYDHTGLDHGHYTEDYNSAKEDFVCRSGLIPEVKLFTREQADEIKASIAYRINNDDDITYSMEDALKSIAARLRAAYPEKDDHGNEEQAVEKQAEAVQTVSAINGEIRPGDWVIVASGVEYKYLVGQVTEIVPPDSPEHDHNNEAENIHVSFVDVQYSENRKDEIVKQLGVWNSLETLNDVLLYPDELIRISGAEISDIEYATFEELLDSRKAAEAYCNQTLDTLHNEKPARHMERLDAKTIYGEVQSGDWVIAAGNSDYGYLIGTVTAIDKLGTPEHGTENDTDDIHIDFTAFNYPPERISEIEENFSNLYGEPKTFDELPLDDVIMAPDELISISNLSFDEITRMGNLRQNCEAFCNCFPGAVIPQNEKHATLIERIKTNFADYHSSLMDLGKQELIDMAEKIAAMSSAYSFLSFRGFENDELDFFLRFQNPLEVMAEGWRDYHTDIDDEMGFAFDTVIHHKQDWLDSYPLMNDTDAPARTDFPIGSMEAHPQHLTEIRNPTKQPARMPKQTLEERLHAASEKAKAQNALNNDTKSHKRDERS